MRSWVAVQWQTFHSTQYHIENLNHHHNKTKLPFSHYYFGCIPLLHNQQFCFGLNRTAFLPVHFFIFEFEYVRTCFISMFYLFAISSSYCAPRGSTERSTDPFLFAWPAHNLLIPLLGTPPTILFWFEQTLHVTQFSVYNFEF